MEMEYGITISNIRAKIGRVRSRWSDIRDFVQVEKNKLGFGILEAILSEENLDFAYLVVIQEKDPIQFLAFIGFQRKRAINWN